MSVVLVLPLNLCQCGLKFEANILEVNPKAYCFFEVEIEAPKNINIPILQLRVNTKTGVKSIAPAAIVAN